ncbi:MAG: ABC transporter ATP-binding protein [Dermatophilaceae bacterium]
MSALQLVHVSREFHGGAGVRDLCLRVPPGEIVALVGLNGAGKTTLMRLMLGMLRPDAGEATLGGVPLARAARQAWSGVGHMVETPLAYPELSVRENLRMAARLHHSDLTVVDPAIERWNLAPDADRRLRRLSLGNRQRVGLAAALQHDPRAVVLDEPSNALDPAGVLVLRDALVESARAGSAVLVSSHHLDEVARIAHRIVVMNAGRIIGGLDPAAPDLERVFFERVRADDQIRGAA